MNTAAAQRPASVPVAGAPAAPASGSGGGFVPVQGQGFVPATGGQPAAGATSGAAAPTGAAPAADPGDGSIAVEEGLKALVEVLGKEYGEPIVGADGTVYMEKKAPETAGGQFQLSYLVVGKIDRATGRMKINPEVAKKASAAQQPARKLVKVDDSWVWQTFQKNKDGQMIALVEPATEQEVAAYAQQQQVAAAQQAAQAGAQDRSDWQQKLSTVSQGLGMFQGVGQFLTQLGAGPDPYTGAPGASWMSAYILAQRLNGRAEGKLLPKWIQTGPVATAIDIGLQAYGMLDLGRDFKIVRDYLSKAPAPPIVNPDAIKNAIAAGTHPAMAEGLNQLGTELRDGTLSLVEGSANATIMNVKTGQLQLVPKASLHDAMKITDATPLAGIKAQEAVDRGIMKGAGLLKGLIQPAAIGASALNLVSSFIKLKDISKKYGVKALIDTQQGRGALMGALTSASYMGTYAAGYILGNKPEVRATLGAVSAGIRIASNVLGGVQMLNSYGLFGGDGFMNNDALRAAFLIPPLTPIGAFAFVMKARKKKADEEAARLAAAQQVAIDKVKQQRELAKSQLQQTGQIAGATMAPDGTMRVATAVPTDFAKLAAQLSGLPTAGAAPAPAAAASAAPSGSAAPAPGPAAAPQTQQLSMMANRPMR